jgi:hypothetical protein
MTPQDMLDYGLGRLDGPHLREFESDLASDESLQRKCDLLRRSIQHLLDDGIEPPPGLRRRTVEFVSAQINPAPVKKPWLSISDFLPRTVPFRLADVAVAAGILLAGLITLLPALHRGKAAADLAACTFNLKQLGLGLGQYATAHHVFPDIEPNDFAVTFAVKLKDGGFLQDFTILDCPCGTPCEDPKDLNDCLAMIRAARSSSPVALPIKCDYAYNVGYLNSNSGRPMCCKPSIDGLTPLVADQPGFTLTGEILEGNSPNHHGRGQNILFADQSVRWYRFRSVMQDGDLYLNDARRPSYGLHERDISLVPGGVRVLAR